jgi:transcription elongation factor GreA-like protein
MKIKRGNVVSHSGALEWGVGKVLEVTPLRATIQFSDGITRKISCSHYTILNPVDAASFLLQQGAMSPPKVRATAKRAKKVKTALA